MNHYLSNRLHRIARRSDVFPDSVWFRLFGQFTHNLESFAAVSEIIMGYFFRKKTKRMLDEVDINDTVLGDLPTVHCRKQNLQKSLSFVSDEIALLLEDWIK